MAIISENPCLKFAQIIVKGPFIILNRSGENCPPTSTKQRKKVKQRSANFRVSILPF